MNTLYVDLDSLDVLETLGDGEFDFVYLDVPYGTNSIASSPFDAYDGEKSVRHYIAKKKKIPFREVTMEEVNQERERQERQELKNYSDYIVKVVENSYRVLDDDGVLAFLSPMNNYTRVNFKIILDQFFPAISNVQIVKKKIAGPNKTSNSNDTLYFCLKKEKAFPVLMELAPKERFPECDERGLYRKITAMCPAEKTSLRSKFDYEWHGIVPSSGRRWRYSKEKMNEMLTKGRVLIKDTGVFLKEYRDDKLVPVSSTWEYTDNTKSRSFIDTQSIERMFSMFTSSNSNLLCPFDRDGKFSWLADCYGLKWTSVYTKVCDKSREMFDNIPKEHYIVINKLKNHNSRSYSNNVVASVNDIEDLNNKVEKMTIDIKRIQTVMGLDSTNSSVDEIIDQIHELIVDTIPQYNIETCLPEAEDWIRPYWDKLEPESKQFIPTGVLLYRQLKDEPDIDMAPIMIEYCKSLENELFKKIFYGYVSYWIERGDNVSRLYPEAFSSNDTKVFAKFIKDCTTRYKKTPSNWRFEIGKMAYVLKMALDDEMNDDGLIGDFKNYLNNIFGETFFRRNFISQLDAITKLRNSCAHPSMVDPDSVDNGKEIIREKLLLILQYYLK